MSDILIFHESESADFKRHVDLRSSHYVLAGPEQLAAGSLMLHTARCPHVNDNKTAKLIAPDEIRVVAAKPRTLLKWLETNDREAYVRVKGCGTCHTSELIDRAAR